MGKPVILISTGDAFYGLDINIDRNTQGPSIYSRTKNAKMRGLSLKGMRSYYQGRLSGQKTIMIRCLILSFHQTVDA